MNILICMLGAVVPAPWHIQDIQTNIQVEDRGRLFSLITSDEAFASCRGEEGEGSSFYIHNIEDI